MTMTHHPRRTVRRGDPHCTAALALFSRVEKDVVAVPGLQRRIVRHVPAAHDDAVLRWIDDDLLLALEPAFEDDLLLVGVAHVDVVVVHRTITPTPYHN